MDAPDGLCIRFQYLNISLSEAEQSSFFSRWGDDIQSVISTGFQKLEKKLNDILFYQIANEVLQNLTIIFNLKRIYQTEEIGHFRIFSFFDITQPHSPIDEIILGASDKAHRMMSDSSHSEKGQQPGSKYGIWWWAWERYYENSTKTKRVYSSSARGMNEVEKISLCYNKDGFTIRYPYNMSIMDINKSYFIFL